MWRQGEHTVIIGMTGCGKTTLAKTLLDKRGYKLMLVTKPDDVLWDGWRQVKTASEVRIREGRSWRLYPEWSKSKQEFSALMDKAWDEGGWTIYADELYHLEHLGLRDKLIQELTQGRSKRLTVVAGVQRPAWVTKFVLSEATHVYCFRLGDDEDRIAIGKRVGQHFAREVSTLGRYEFAYLNKLTGEVHKGTVKTLDGVLRK